MLLAASWAGCAGDLEFGVTADGSTRAPDVPKPHLQPEFQLAARASELAGQQICSTLGSASQAEYAGSIPVIGSTLITADAARRCSTRSLAVMSVSQRDSNSLQPLSALRPESAHAAASSGWRPRA